MEIGSDFWINSTTSFENVETNHFFKYIVKDYYSIFTISGRTAIDIIIKDIISKNINLSIAYLPAYCCKSMIIPFINNNIKVEFYDVQYIPNYGLVPNIDINFKCSIIILMDYFGFEICTEFYNEVSNNFKKKNVIIVNDVTHSLLIENYIDNHFADYYFGSIRKWDAFTSGGFVLSKKEYASFNLRNNNSFFESQYFAMKAKEQYLNSQFKLDKIEYLNRFKSNQIQLNINYEMYTIDSYSYEKLIHWNIEDVIKKRRENASHLYFSLQGMNDCFSFVYEFDMLKCPIFIPIIIKNGYRDELHQYLISNNIYLPIHWNQRMIHYNGTEFINDNILSLVCDQRYEFKDIEQISNRIKSFFINKKI